VAFPDLNNGWAADDTGKIISTSNGGGTWTAQTSPITNGINHMVFHTASRGWAVSDSGDIITYTGAPTVESISPTSGPGAGGTTVTIKGCGFSGATGVTFGSAAGTNVTVVNDATITVTSPPGTGTG